MRVCYARPRNQFAAVDRANRPGTGYWQGLAQHHLASRNRPEEPSLPFTVNHNGIGPARKQANDGLKRSIRALGCVNTRCGTWHWHHGSRCATEMHQNPLAGGGMGSLTKATP